MLAAACSPSAIMFMLCSWCGCGVWEKEHYWPDVPVSSFSSFCVFTCHRRNLVLASRNLSRLVDRVTKVWLVCVGVFLLLVGLATSVLSHRFHDIDLVLCCCVNNILGVTSNCVVSSWEPSCSVSHVILVLYHCDLACWLLYCMLYVRCGCWPLSELECDLWLPPCMHVCVPTVYPCSYEANGPGDDAAQSAVSSWLSRNRRWCSSTPSFHVSVRAAHWASRQGLAVPAVCCWALWDHFFQGRITLPQYICQYVILLVCTLK